jgi:hypothetical protein
MTGQFDWKLVRAPDGGVRAVQVDVPGPDGEEAALHEYGYVPGKRGIPARRSNG